MVPRGTPSIGPRRTPHVVPGTQVQEHFFLYLLCQGIQGILLMSVQVTLIRSHVGIQSAIASVAGPYIFFTDPDPRIRNQQYGAGVRMYRPSFRKTKPKKLAFIQ